MAQDDTGISDIVGISGIVTPKKKNNKPANTASPVGEAKYAGMDEDPSGIPDIDIPKTVTPQQATLNKATPPQDQGIGDKLFNAASRFSSGALTQLNPKNAFRPLYDPYGAGKDMLDQMHAVREQAAQEQNPIDKVIRYGLGYVPMAGPAISSTLDAMNKARFTGDYGDLAEITGNVAGAALMPSVYKNLAFTAAPAALAKVAKLTQPKMLENYQKLQEINKGKAQAADLTQTVQSGPTNEAILQKAAPKVVKAGDILDTATNDARAKVYTMAKNARSNDFTLEEAPNPNAGQPEPYINNFKTTADYNQAKAQWDKDQQPIQKPTPIEAPVRLQNTQPYVEQVMQDLNKEMSDSPKATAALKPVYRELENIVNQKETVDAQGKPTGLTAMNFQKVQSVNEALQHYLAKQPSLSSEGGYSPRMVNILDGLHENIEKDIDSSANQWGQGIQGKNAVNNLRKAVTNQATTAAKNQNILDFAQGGPGSPTYTKLLGDILKDPSHAENYINSTKDRQGLSTMLMRDLVSNSTELSKDGEPIFNPKKAFDHINSNSDLYNKVLPKDQLDQLKQFIQQNQKLVGQSADYPGTPMSGKTTAFHALSVPAGLISAMSSGHTSLYSGLISGLMASHYVTKYGMYKLLSNPDMAQAFIKMAKQPGSSPISQLMSGMANESLKRASVANVPQSISRKSNQENQ